jgi:hypothetical protein
VRPEVVVVGLGEVGRPLLELVRRKGRPALGIDVGPAALPDRGSVRVLHICFPFEIPDFVGETARYIDLIAPRITIVNSTVGVGTTRAVHERTGARIAHSPLAKLTETTYFGLLIAWAQEIERYCDRLDLDYDEIVSFYEEIGFLPPAKYFPGVIGGHCVMPNIEILSRVDEGSVLLDAIRSSNAQKQGRDETAGSTAHAAPASSESVALS